MSAMLLGAAVLMSQTQPATRSYRMGFGLAAPRFEIPLILKSIDEWSKRGDGAIDHREPPWRRLLSGENPEDYIRKEVLPVMELYRKKGFVIACTIDVANGIDRSKEASELVALGKSVTQPDVQKVYVDYVAAFARLVKPTYLGLGAELNLLGDLTPRPVYDAIAKMDAVAARAAKAVSPATKLYVSVQADWAWGRMPKGAAYRGCEKIFRDFPFIEVLGVSSYPGFGWDDPDQIPVNYYRRLLGDHKMPVIMVEGGWPSTVVEGAKSDPTKEARWVTKLSKILDDCHASFLGLLTYTDLDVAHIPEFKGTIMPMFSTMGMVNIDFKPKPALAAWDEVFRRPFTP